MERVTRARVALLALGLLGLLALPAQDAAAAEAFTLAPRQYARTAIVLSADAGPVARFAAQELQEHLRLLTGHEFAVVGGPAGLDRSFIVGVRPAADTRPLATEEARYRVTRQAVYLYGEDLVRRPGSDLFHTVAGSPGATYTRAGTLFAVYSFLERELGVRWLEPGPDGVFYTPRRRLRLTVGEYSWTSQFEYQRNLRSYLWQGTDTDPGYVPRAFVLTPEQARARRDELDLWLRRMRMGAKSYLSFGHAFTDWWARYGQEHAEYFAVNGRGVREPLFTDEPDRVQVCPTEPGVVRQAVANWLARRQEDTLSTRALCVAQNDGGGGGSAEYCHCERCLAEDVRLAGEAFGDHLTDRYLYLANRALAAARQQVPDALVTSYAYSVTVAPPRRLRVADGVVLEFVTAMNTPLEETEALYDAWQAQGARRLMFRPNDLCVELGLPLGQEQRLADHQRIAVRHGALGTDHDGLYGLWTGISGFSYYVLARSHVEPGADFARWEDEYTAAFGAAQPEIRAVLRQWRDRFEQVILPADLREQAAQSGLQRPGFLAWGGLDGMSRRIEEFYSEADFDRVDALLGQALARPLTPLQHRQVRRLVLANQHNRLTFLAMRAVAGGDDARTRQEARALLDFRTAVRDSLQINWWALFSAQHQMGDACGITLLMNQERLADRRGLVCVRAAQPPVLDGHLDEAVWQAARTGVPFLTNQSAAVPQAGTRALLAYDAENLYVAVDCREPAISRAVEKETQRDGTVWQDNAVELFLDPTCSRRDFYQLIVSSAGTLLDGRRVDGSFGVDWNLTVGRDIEYTVAKGDSSWVVELRLPFRAVGMEPPAAGGRMRLNVTRDRVVAGQAKEASALSPTFGGFHLPQRFADLVFE